MVKVRMNTADVAAEVKCLRRLIGMRCSNVYDLSPKTYVFKLMNSRGVSESSESEKVLVLMESGVRLHTTVYMRDKSNTPSGFTLKLRKHIRMRQLEDVHQLGYDRLGNHGSNLTEEELETHTISAWKEGKSYLNRQNNGLGTAFSRRFIHAGPYDSLKDIAAKILQKEVSN